MNALNRQTQAVGLKHIDILKMELEGRIVYGCDQAWFTHSWQEMAGCGPTVGAMMLIYLNSQNPAWQLPYRYGTREYALAAMQDVWNYIKPGLKGVNSTQKFQNGLRTLCAHYALRCDVHTLDIPRGHENRPGPGETAAFIQKALRQDCPVAFLNLNRGHEPALESWHWVMLHGLYYDNARGCYMGEIIDQSERKSFSLDHWLHRTTLGGGFVYLKPLLFL